MYILGEKVNGRKSGQQNFLTFFRNIFSSGFRSPDPSVYDGSETLDLRSY